MHDKWITMWRKPDNILEWDFYVSNSLDEVERVINNIVKLQGIHQFSTYPLGERMAAFSSEY